MKNNSFPSEIFPEGVQFVPMQLCDMEEDPIFPNPNLLNYYIGLKNRTLYITEDISVDSLIEYTKLIIQFNRQDAGKPIEDRQPIKIMIFSYGGELDIALHFMEICKISTTPIYTYNLGVAMSAAFYILLTGKKRFALRDSQVLIHQGSGGAGGTYEQVQSITRQYAERVTRLEAYLLERTNISKQKFNREKGKEWFVNGEDQLNLGIVDEMVDSIDVLL